MAVEDSASAFRIIIGQFFHCSSTLSFDASNVSERMIADEPELEDMTLYKDSNACMKAAFLYYVSKKSVSQKLTREVSEVKLLA